MHACTRYACSPYEYARARACARARYLFIERDSFLRISEKSCCHACHECLNAKLLKPTSGMSNTPPIPSPQGFNPSAPGGSSRVTGWRGAAIERLGWFGSSYGGGVPVFVPYSSIRMYNSEGRAGPARARGGWRVEGGGLGGFVSRQPGAQQCGVLSGYPREPRGPRLRGERASWSRKG